MISKYDKIPISNILYNVCNAIIVTSNFLELNKRLTHRSREAKRLEKCLFYDSLN